MTLEVFMLLLMVVSVLVSLTVESIKKNLEERGKTYYANSLAGIVAVVIGIVVGVFYCIVAGVAFNIMSAVWLIALVFLSWLCSMVGYDKVKQAIEQFKL